MSDDTLRAALEAHEPHSGNHDGYACGFSGPHCWECGEPWPCRAIRGQDEIARNVKDFLEQQSATVKGWGGSGGGADVSDATVNAYACDDCARLTSGRCWRHQNQIEALATLTHVHEWRLAGQLADGQVLLLCAHHDPPETRLVRP